MKHSHLTVQVNECKINYTAFSPFFEKKKLMENYNNFFFFLKVSFVQPHHSLICGLRQKCRKTKIIQPRNILYTYSSKYMYYKIEVVTTELEYQHVQVMQLKGWAVWYKCINKCIFTSTCKMLIFFFPSGSTSLKMCLGSNNFGSILAGAI